ncbi:MAG: MFS transporter [Syntrophales bacterium]|nr:MFS transporter [Syntrophales bacterium]
MSLHPCHRFGSLCGGLLSLAVGPVLDRQGPRMVTFWGILLLSLGLGAMMFANHIWRLYLFFGVGRMVAIGVLSLSVSVSIANWFVRLRGRAMGITKIGDRLGSALLPLMVQFLILALGWRMAWGALGAVVFLMSGIPALVFLRHRPEDMGLSPDGALGTALIFLLAALHGLFLGGRNPMIPVIWANFFGRRSLGSIYSLGNPFILRPMRSVRSLPGSSLIYSAVMRFPFMKSSRRIPRPVGGVIH